MSAPTETRYFEVRAETEGRLLSGVAVRYGDLAVIPRIGKETFAPRAFGDLALADVILTSHHARERPLARTGGGGLVLEDGAGELRVIAELPNTALADETLTLVRSKVLRGLSVEFASIREVRRSGVRVIQRARLFRIGVVDSPAYGQSVVEARAEADTTGRRIWL